MTTIILKDENTGETATLTTKNFDLHDMLFILARNTDAVILDHERPGV